MATKIGLEGELFRGEAGKTANTLIGNVKDVTLNLEAGEADITTRKADGWRMSKATLKEASLEFTINYDPEDEDTKAFMVAFLEGTPLALFFGDGSGNGLDRTSPSPDSTWNSRWKKRRRCPLPRSRPTSVAKTAGRRNGLTTERVRKVRPPPRRRELEVNQSAGRKCSVRRFSRGENVFIQRQ